MRPLVAFGDARPRRSARAPRVLRPPPQRRASAVCGRGSRVRALDGWAGGRRQIAHNVTAAADYRTRAWRVFDSP